jgi:hypothetical protein
MALGDGIRRNISTVSVDERHRLRDAIIALHKRFYPGARTDSPAGGVSYWFKQDEIHAHTHVHGCPAFIPWHRELINQFEANLREIDPLLSLHYWDWTTNPNALFTSDFMGSASGAAGDPWLSAGIYNPGANPFRSDNEFDPNNNPFDPPRTLNRSVEAGAPVTAAQDNAIVNAANFPDLNNLLTQAHNSAHGFIGGTIGNPHTSFRDPFVFLLHSNVDRLFAQWQVQQNHAERLNPDTIYGADGATRGSGDVQSGDPFWGILSPLEPWAGAAAQNAATGIVANVQATRPWAAPESEQLQVRNQKDSKHYSVVIPAAYDTFAPRDGTWRGADLTQLAGAPVAGVDSLAGYSWGTGGAKQVAYIGADNHIHELYVSTYRPWAYADLSQLTGAPAVTGAALAAYAWETGRSKQVVYLTANGHVHELYVSSGGAWAHADLTQMTGAPPASGSALAAYAWESGGSKQVVYMTADGHIHELFVTVGHSWAHADLTQITGGPPAAGSNLVGYAWEVGESKQVVYTTADGHIHELYVSIGKNWGHADLTQLTNAPAVNGGAFVAYAWEEAGTKQVAYLTNNGHVHELYVGVGQSWAHADLTQITGAPSAAGTALGGYSWKNGNSKQVVFLDANGHLNELWVRTGGSWSAADLTALTNSPVAIATTSLSGYGWYTGGSKQVVYLIAGNHVQELYV